MNTSPGGGAFVPPPCPFCAGGTFVHVQNVNIEWFIAGSRTSEMEFHGGVLVCTGCGRVELFMRTQDLPEWATSVSANLVKRPPEGPYR